MDNVCDELHFNRNFLTISLTASLHTFHITCFRLQNECWKGKQKLLELVTWNGTIKIKQTTNIEYRKFEDVMVSLLNLWYLFKIISRFFCWLYSKTQLKLTLLVLQKFNLTILQECCQMLPLILSAR